MESPQPIGRFLGCQQTIGQMTLSPDNDPRLRWMKSNPPKKEPPVILKPGTSGTVGNKSVQVNVMRFDMANFLEQCIERYIELAGSKILGKIKPASTPFLDESKAEFDENEIISKIRSASAAAMDSYPNSPEGQALTAALSQGGGMLAHIASAVLMKIFICCSNGSF